MARLGCQRNDPAACGSHPHARAVRDSSAARREAAPPLASKTRRCPRTTSRRHRRPFVRFFRWTFGEPQASTCQRTTRKSNPWNRSPDPRPPIRPPGGGFGLLFGLPGFPALQCKAERRRPPRGRAERSERPRGRLASRQAQKKAPPYCFHPIVSRQREGVSRPD